MLVFFLISGDSAEGFFYTFSELISGKITDLSGIRGGIFKNSSIQFLKKVIADIKHNFVYNLKTIQYKNQIKLKNLFCN